MSVSSGFGWGDRALGHIQLVRPWRLVETLGLRGSIWFGLWDWRDHRKASRVHAEWCVGKESIWLHAWWSARPEKPQEVGGVHAWQSGQEGSRGRTPGSMHDQINHGRLTASMHGAKQDWRDHRKMAESMHDGLQDQRDHRRPLRFMSSGLAEGSQNVSRIHA